MLSFTEGDSAVPMRAVFRQDSAVLSVALTTLTGFLIYQDGTRIPITPVYDTDAAGDGSDGAVFFDGDEQIVVPVGLHSFQFFSTLTLGSNRRSTKKIPFRVLPNA